jgi:hypothetical protein
LLGCARSALERAKPGEYQSSSSRTSRLQSIHN